MLRSGPQRSNTGRFLRNIAYWATPSLLCQLLYWNGLRAWFQMDDFAWLTLASRVHDIRSFFEAMVTPYAQGTVRTFSERLFFIGFWWIFGLDALPFRILVALTQIANLVLLSTITRRLTNSALAGFAAPVLWIVNPSLHLPMTWTSAYNQVLCATCLLLAFYLFLRYVETGLGRFYWSQFAVFLFGFGVLELNVVHPALAALFALCRAPQYFARTLPMFGVSALYVTAHQMLVAKQTSLYAMHYDSDALGLYLRWAIGADHLGRPILPYAAGFAILLFLGYKLLSLDRLAVFVTGWFAFTIAPYLSLSNQVQSYYLTIPTIAIAMAGGWALSMPLGTRVRILTAAVFLAYFVPSALQTYALSKETAEVSLRTRSLLEGVAYVHSHQPGKVILLKNIDQDLFWAACYHRPFQLAGNPFVHLTPETRPLIRQIAGLNSISSYFLGEEQALREIEQGQAVVYEVLPGRLRNVTSYYQRILERRRVDTMEPL